MLLTLMLSVLFVAADRDSEPYKLGAPATVEGAMLTVTHLLDVTKAGDDNAFDKIARGMAIMLAPDFGVPVSRAEFAETLKNCSDLHVISSRPFPKMPQVQAVQVAMQCHDDQHLQPSSAIAEIMADNEHTFAVFPGGVSRVWPDKNALRQSPQQ